MQNAAISLTIFATLWRKDFRPTQESGFSHRWNVPFLTMLKHVYINRPMAQTMPSSRSTVCNVFKVVIIVQCVLSNAPKKEFPVQSAANRKNLHEVYLFMNNNWWLIFCKLFQFRLDLGSVIFVHPECNDTKFAYCHHHCYHEPRGSGKRARYPGTCKRCAKAIAVNDDIELLDTNWVHVGCTPMVVLTEKSFEDMAKKALIESEGFERTHSPLSFQRVSAFFC